jgi:acetyl esterase/lipase
MTAKLRPAALAAAALALFVVAGCGDKGPEIGPGKPPNQVSGAKVAWGEPPGGSPAGLVLLLPGGGWRPDDNQFELQKASAKGLQGQGYATAVVYYAPGPKGLRQIQDVYKVGRQHYPGLPVCASGLSSGGNLALMLATREPDLTCVIATAAPTDLTTLAEQDPEGDEAYAAAVDVFGADGLAKFSPVRYAKKIKAKVQLVIAESDPLDPIEQGRELVKALPGTDFITVPPGPITVPWAHFGGVPVDASDEILKRQLDFLKQVTQG